MTPYSEYSHFEFGYPQPNPVPVEKPGMPRGDAKIVVPHPATFAGIPNLAARTYFWQFDEAVRHSRENARRAALDPVVVHARAVRSYAISLIPFHLEPDDPDDEQQQRDAKDAEMIFRSLPGAQTAYRWLVYDGEWTGRTAYQLRYRWQSKRGKLWHVPDFYRPVSGDKLVYKWDDTLGILVNAAFQGASHETDLGDGRNRAYFLTPEEREQFVVHTFEPEDVDFYLPQMAGAVKGTGLRGKIYWLLALKNRVWSLGMDFLRWFAQGVTAFYFESGNDQHRQEVQEWVEAGFGSSALLFPRMKDGGPGYKPMERFEPGTASSQFIQTLIAGYFDDLITKAILHQSLTTGTAPTGLGSGVASAHEGTFENVVKYGANLLDETRSRDLLGPWYATNKPGTPPAHWRSEVDNPNVQQMLDAAEVIYQMGGRVPEQPLLDAAGLPEVKEGDTILTNVQPMQPSAVDGMPDGVPVVTGQPVEQPQQLNRRMHPNYSRIVKLARMKNQFALRWLATGRMFG